jgi:hypothetical protein
LETIKFGDWTAQVDADANRSAYSRIPYSAAEDCACAECLNFVEARNRGLVYSAQVLGLFKRMGVDSTRESEVYAMDAVNNRSGLTLYGGWFNVIGQLSGEDAKGPTEITGELQLFPMAGAALPDPAFGEVPMFRSEFVIALPWLLGEPQPNAPRRRKK